MESEVSKNVECSVFRVMFTNGSYGNCFLNVPRGLLEAFVVSALSAGTDVSISSVYNESYRKI